MSSFGSVLSTAYDGSAQLGVFEGTLKLVCGIIICLIFLIIGIVLFTKNQNNLVDSVATITDVHCVQQTTPIGTRQQGRPTNICNLEINYIVDGKNYSGTIIVSGYKSYNKGSNIDITYDSKNPLNVQTKVLRNRTFAYISIGVGLCIGACVCVNYYMTTHFKMYAAAEGMGAVANAL